MNYKVGQILYMTSAKSLKIIPIQVVEEVSRTTLTGTEKNYIIQLPDENKTKAKISSLKSELFSDIELLKQQMIANAKESIEKMVEIAKEVASSEFITSDNANKNIKQDLANVQVENKNNIILVDLGNGVQAKMSKEELKKVTNQ